MARSLDAEVSLPVDESEGATPFLDDQIVVGFSSDTSAALLPSLTKAMGRLGGHVVRTDPILSFAVVSVPAQLQERALKAATALPGVTYAKPDMRVEALYTPNDPLYGDQWGPAPIGMPLAWNTTRGNHNVTVAVIDTGVNASHPDLAPNMCVVGPDFINNDLDADDDHGHGTHVAGTVAASIDNGIGVAGMADVCIMSVKVLSQYGSGSFSAVASGIAWAAENGADILSMSLGGCCDPGEPMTSAIAYARDQGALIVAAAGNSGCGDTVGYPAAYPEVVAVAALQEPGTSRAWFSSCGEQVEVSAPGQDILSTALTSGQLSDPSGYMNLSGTSMATPHVSGVAALVLSHNASLSAIDLRCILAQTADDLGVAGRDEEYGFGRIDASAALGTSCVPELPGAPRLSGYGRSERALLSWSEPSSFGSALSEYRVYRGTDPLFLSLVATLDASTRDYTDTGLVNGATYYYAVSAVNGLGEGAASETLAVTPAAPAPFACSVGNDTYGNTCTSADYAWIDIHDTGDALPGADDALFNVVLPFAFEFYGTSYLSLNVSTNGFLNFYDGTNPGCCSPRPMPDADSPNGLLAGYWADLLPMADRSIVTQTMGLVGERVFVIQYTDVPFWGDSSGATATFQFQLFEATGNAEVHYLDTTVPVGWYEAGAGIEDCNGRDGLQATMTTEPIYESAFRITPGNGTAPVCRPNTPPVVTIVTPGDGDTVRGTVVINGTATDEDEGDAVEYLYGYFFNETEWYYFPVDGTTTWSTSFDTTQVGDGAWTIQISATDGSAWVYTTISVTVDNTRPDTPPVATITSPSDGATVDETFLVQGRAFDADNDTITNVTFRVDGGYERTANGTTSWYANITTTPGAHTISARAWNGSVAGEWTNITVTVAPPPTERPDVAVTAIEVVRNPLRTDFFTAPNNVNEMRTVRVTLTNLGEGPTTAASGWVWLEASAGNRTPLAMQTARYLGTSGDLALAPGASVTFDIAWDTTLDFGDVTVYAWASAPYDADWRNNAMEHKDFVRVGGINHGVLLTGYLP